MYWAIATFLLMVESCFLYSTQWTFYSYGLYLIIFPYFLDKTTIRQSSEPYITITKACFEERLLIVSWFTFAARMCVYLVLPINSIQGLSYTRVVLSPYIY